MTRYTLLIGLVLLPAAASSTLALTVIVNDRILPAEPPPVERAGRVLLPLRSLFEALQATVDWEADTLTVSAQRAGRTVRLRIGSRTAHVDGNPVSLEVGPQLIGPRAYVPLRFAAEALGAEVDWDPATRTVRLSLKAEPAPSDCGDWRSEFIIMVGWPAEETSVAAMAQAGFNVLKVPQSTLDECQRHGVRALVTDATPQQAAELSRHPALWGYFVRDEPPYDELEPVAQQVAAFHEADPCHPAYVNLQAGHDLNRYIQLVRPRVLSYDYYEWWFGEAGAPDAPTAGGTMYLTVMGQHRRAALAAGLPLLIWVEANSDPVHAYGVGQIDPDNPDEAKKRQSVYTSLAYGARGIQWFTGGLCFVGDELTEAGRSVVALNAELQILGPELMRLESLAVYHTDPSPAPAHAPVVPADFWAQVDGEDWLLGVFTDEAADRHLLLVNRDHTRRRWAVVRVAGPKSAAEIFDKRTGEWTPLPHRSRNGWDSAEFWVAPGGGELLRFY